jgi:hypothetical protein
MTHLLARVLAHAYCRAANRAAYLDNYGWGGGAWTGR